jgi:hypothetical protein
MKYKELEAGGVKIIEEGDTAELTTTERSNIRLNALAGTPALSTQIGGDHYKSMKIQTVDFCMANELDYCQANVIKYVCRYEQKNGIEDLNKAIHYLELLKEIKYG